MARIDEIIESVLDSIVSVLGQVIKFLEKWFIRIIVNIYEILKFTIIAGIPICLLFILGINIEGMWGFILIALSITLMAIIVYAIVNAIYKNKKEKIAEKRSGSRLLYLTILNYFIVLWLYIIFIHECSQSENIVLKIVYPIVIKVINTLYPLSQKLFA
ncbi:MAG: hypothetical protein R3F48_17410 [Candidatus Zixiibacteriota bacterium]